MTTQCDECGESAVTRFLDDEKRCGYFCEVCVPSARAFDPERYRAAVVRMRPSVALSLLDYWDHPWSSSAQRFALHVLRTALSRGINVLEATP